MAYDLLNFLVLGAPVSMPVICAGRMVTIAGVRGVGRPGVSEMGQALGRAAKRLAWVLGGLGLEFEANTLVDGEPLGMAESPLTYETPLVVDDAMISSGGSNGNSNGRRRD